MMTALRKLRMNRGLQRKFVASKIGICGKHLNDIEGGKVNLTNNVAKRFSEFYDLEVKEIENMYMEGKDEAIRNSKKTKPTS